MKKFLLYLWQLPQNVLGMLVIAFTKAVYSTDYDIWVADGYHFGVSLGRFIILGGHAESTSVLHERGHQRQSLYLGWFYLLLIGLPSALGNVYDQIAHQEWYLSDREKWYYSQPWEKWADKLGGVDRGIE